MYEYVNNISYSYAPFRGKDFLKDYFKLREHKIKTSKGKNEKLDEQAINIMKLLFMYEKTKKLRLLNTALKMNDKICSNKRITNACADTLEYEIKIIRELLNREGIDWE